MNGCYIVIHTDGRVDFEEWKSMKENVERWTEICGGHFIWNGCSNLTSDVYMLSSDYSINVLKNVNLVATYCYGIGENVFSVAGDVVLVKHEYNSYTRNEIEVPFSDEDIAILAPMLHRARVAAKVTEMDSEF